MMTNAERQVEALLAEVERLRGVEVELVKLSRAIDRAFADPERPQGRPQDNKLDSDALALSEEVYELIGAARYDEIEAALEAGDG